MTYSKQEATTLKNYYSPKMIGKVLEESIGCKVDEIEVSPLNNGEYSMRAICHHGADIFWREITDAAKVMNLPSPEEVLSSKD